MGAMIRSNQLSISPKRLVRKMHPEIYTWDAQTSAHKTCSKDTPSHHVFVSKFGGCVWRPARLFLAHAPVPDHKNGRI